MLTTLYQYENIKNIILNERGEPILKNSRADLFSITDTKNENKVQYEYNTQVEGLEGLFSSFYNVFFNYFGK